MKLKSKKDHYQGQNEAWKSAIHILQRLLLKCHIILFFKSKKSEIFTTNTCAIFVSTLKRFAQNSYFWPLFWGVKDCWYSILTFLKLSCTCGFGGLWLGTWWVRGELGLLLGDEEVMGSIPVGGGLIPWCVGRGHEVGDRRRRWAISS
jgi:hypothetical protein